MRSMASATIAFRRPQSACDRSACTPRRSPPCTVMCARSQPMLEALTCGARRWPSLADAAPMAGPRPVCGVLRVRPQKLFACAAMPIAPRLRFVHIMLALAFALLVSVPASAATLVAIVSERNAAEMAQVAQSFHAAHPQHQLVFRTSAQIDANSDASLDALVRSADTILITTVFKETAQRIIPVVRASNVKSVIALAGDPGLGRNSRWNGERLFSDADARYDELSSLTDDKDANPEAVAAAARKYPQLAAWIQARGYWQNRNPANLQSLLALVLSPVDASLRAQMAPLQSPQTVRILRGNQWIAV